MRTEQDVLNDFEKLGYEDKSINPELAIILLNKNVVIAINKRNKKYSKHKRGEYEADNFTIQEHKLLNELFQIWGWLE